MQKKTTLALTRRLFSTEQQRRREVLDSQLKFEFGTLNAILGKSLMLELLPFPCKLSLILLKGIWTSPSCTDSFPTRLLRYSKLNTGMLTTM